MKKNFVAKIFTVALALVVCLVPMLTVLANAQGEESVPIIDIHGLMASDIYVDPNDPDSELAWPPTVDSILEAVKEAVPSIASFALTNDWDTFGDDVCRITEKMFKPVYLSSEGTVNNTSGVRFTYPEPDTIKKDSVVKFKYDWRLDPIEVAKQLNDYINYVLECSGSKTVKITCHSLGGVITNTYLTLYGHSKVSGVCFNATAIYGQTYVGELLQGKIVLDADALQQFLEYVLDYNDYNDLINGAMEILAQAGLFDYVCNLGNEIVDHILIQASKEVLAPMFGCWPSIWAMVKDEDIDESMNFFFNNFDNGTDYTVLQGKINNYNKLVRVHKTENLKKLNETANVYVLSRYGYPSIPITPSANVYSDGVVDVLSTSFGATVAPYGETLSDEYLATVDAKYVSPDKTIDASTCLFPEQTWFIKDFQHANNPDSVDNMIYTLLRYDGQATVDTFEQYPRFCTYDHVNDEINPDTAKVVADTPFYRLGCMIREIFNLIVTLVNKIAGK